MQRRSIKKNKRSKKPLVFLLVLAGLMAAGWYYIQPEKISTAQTKSDTSAQSQSTEIKAAARTKMRTFTNQDFVGFYSSFAYPNNAEIMTPPPITGNAPADEHIRVLAEKRGYKLRSMPIASPILLKEGYEIQQKAEQPLLDMQSAAKKAGYSINLTAAFRSIDTQKELFVSRLLAAPADIAAGTADASVNETLSVTAPPGYSRHHNGFTVDFSCGDIGGEAFLGSGCYAWLSKNNFENAKNFGWIPSYPEGSHASGPEPEPWEFVWVGRDSLLE